MARPRKAATAEKAPTKKVTKPAPKKAVKNAAATKSVAKKVVTKNAPAKAEVETIGAKPVVESAATSKRVGTRSELRGVRNRISEMNSTQLVQFYAGFNSKVLARMQAAIVKAESGKSNGEIVKLEAEITKLNRRVAVLKGEI